MSREGDFIPDSFSGKSISTMKELLALKRYPEPTIEVCEPQLKADTIGKHHLYKVKGSDHLGEFEIFRRFKQFDMLRRTLFSRFLGLYVPPIPEKKAMGNTTNYFVEERMHYLNKFIQAICKLPYLYESYEFATFLRPAGDLDMCFQQLPPQTTLSVYMRLRDVVPLSIMITEDPEKVKELNYTVVANFQKESQALLQSLQSFKNQMKFLVPLKEQEVFHYKNFVDFLGKYEEVNAKTTPLPEGATDESMISVNNSQSIMYG